MNEDSRRLLALSIYHCVNDGSLAIFAAVLPVMRLGLGLDFVQIGTILGAGLLATMILQILFGSLSDKGHASEVLILGFATIVAVDLIFPISSAFLEVLIFYVLLRSAAAVYHPVSFSSIGRTHTENKSQAFGYQGAIGDLGLAFGTFSTGILSEMWGWRVPFWVWGTIGLILFAYFAATTTRYRLGFYAQPTVPASENGGYPANPGIARSVRSTFAMLTLVSSITTVSFLIFTGYMPLYFNIVEGLSPAWSTTIVAVWVGIGVFAGFITGRVVNRFAGEAKALQVMFALESVLFLIANVMLYVKLPSSSESLIRHVAIALTGVPIFVTFPATYGLLGLRMPHTRLGLTYALNLSLGLMVASVATYLTGYLASVASIAVALPILLIVAVLGTAASFRV